MAQHYDREQFEERPTKYVTMEHCKRSTSIERGALGLIALLLGVLIWLMAVALDRSSAASAAASSLNVDYQSTKSAQQEHNKAVDATLQGLQDDVREIKRDVKEILKHSK